MSDPTNWDICALCQIEDGKGLICPNNKSGTGYRTVAENILAFHDIGCIPIPTLNIERINDGSGIEETFIKNSAKWHESCKLKFNNTKLKRAQERDSSQSEGCSDQIPTKRLRKSIQPNVSQSDDSKDEEMGICFFCDQEVPITETLPQMMAEEQRLVAR